MIRGTCFFTKQVYKAGRGTRIFTERVLGKTCFFIMRVSKADTPARFGYGNYFIACFYSVEVYLLFTKRV